MKHGYIHYTLLIGLLAGELCRCAPSSSEEMSFTSSESYEEFGASIPPPSVHLDFTYHNYTALTHFLHQVAVNYPSLTHLYSIGKSVQGKDLWVLAVSSTPDRHEPGKPEVKFVANIHGNEPVSKEILLHFIMHLVSRYDYDDVITLLLNRTRIHFLLSMNPDGFERSKEGVCDKDKGRRNGKDIDLNRNFPDYFDKGNNVPIQPETRAVMDWTAGTPFVLSAGLHGGALVASYPYENTNANRPVHIFGREEHLSPDDDVFKHLASVYATNHATMHEGKPCPGAREGFPNGIVNGAKWYIVRGGMQDYNYIYHGTMEITLEVSCCKHPKAETLKQYWIENRKALMSYVYEALRGVKGFVTDGEDGMPLKGVHLRIKGRERGFNTTADGEYWRILLDGNYTLQASHEGYQTLELPFQVRGDDATTLDVTMYRRPDYQVPKQEPAANSYASVKIDSFIISTCTVVLLMLLTY